MKKPALLGSLFVVSACAFLAGCGGDVLAGAVSNPAGPVSSAVSNGPQLGYVWEAADRSLRPILGVPGSSQVGEPVTPAGLYVAGAASARSSVAVLELEDGSLDTLQLPSGATVPVAGTEVAADAQILFSPSGLNAIAFSTGGSSVTLLTGLGSTPQAQVLASSNAVLGAAVSDAGTVAVISGGGPLSVALLTGSKGTVASLTGLGGLSFLPGGDDLLAADSSTGTLTLVRKSSSAPLPQTFASSLVQSPLAVGASQDGRWAVVANGADPSVVRVDLTGGTAALRIGCTCQPALLAGFSGNAVFRVTTPGAGPTWMIDASAATPQALFIPAQVKP